MQNIINAAQKSMLFNGMSQSDIEKLINQFAPIVKSFEKGQIIVLEGDEVLSMGLIVDGTAVAIKTNAAGDALAAAKLEKGDVFGDMLAASAGAKSPVTVEAEIACTVAFIRHSVLFDTQSQEETARLLLLKNMLQSMADKYFLQEQRVSVLAEKNLKNRVKRWLRYEVRAQGKKTVNVASRAHMAATLGCDRAALCRVLSEMQAAGEIAIEKKAITKL